MASYSVMHGFSAFRSVASHEAKILRAITEQDATNPSRGVSLAQRALGRGVDVIVGQFQVRCQMAVAGARGTPASSPWRLLAELSCLIAWRPGALR